MFTRVSVNKLKKKKHDRKLSMYYDHFNFKTVEKGCQEVAQLVEHLALGLGLGATGSWSQGCGIRPRVRLYT